MNVAWTNLTSAQQTEFMRSAGLSALPDPAALTEAQFNVLVGIVGQETAADVRNGVPPADTLSTPELPLPDSATSGDWSNIMMMVAELRAKLGELQTSISAGEIEGQKNDIKEMTETEAQRIKDMIEKIDKRSKSGLIGKIFGWIGAIIGAIGALVATIATGGAAAPALAVAVMGLAVMTLQETGAMEKIMEAVAENPAIALAVFGPLIGGILAAVMEGADLSEEDRMMALQITLGVVMAAASITAMVASGGAAASDLVFKIIGIVGQAAGGLASLGGGAAGVAQAVYADQVTQLQADSQEIQAWLTRLKALLDEEMARLEELLRQMNQGVVDASDMLESIAGSHQTVTNHLGA